MRVSGIDESQRLVSLRLGLVGDCRGRISMMLARMIGGGLNLTFGTRLKGSRIFLMAFYASIMIVIYYWFTTKFIC